jgi:hypothetical protein
MCESDLGHPANMTKDQEGEEVFLKDATRCVNQWLVH